MPSHLHPRSSATSTLFGVTLLASFVVVGIPHIFPCPALEPLALMALPPNNHDRQTELSQQTELEIEAAVFRQLEMEAAELANQKRECPVPKPGKVLGRLFGRENAAVEERTGKRAGLDTLVLHPATRKS